jgi:hypothetical protein
VLLTVNLNLLLTKPRVESININVTAIPSVESIELSAKPPILSEPLGTNKQLFVSNVFA